MDEFQSERQQLAEEWRLVGKLLRERSPALFEKLLVVAAACALRTIPEEAENISSTNALS
jgi:hypothetical protein